MARSRGRRRAGWLCSGFTLNRLSSGYTLKERCRIGCGDVAPLRRHSRPVRGDYPAANQRCCRPGFGLTVAAEDGDGDVDASFDGAVSVSLIDLAGGGATLGGTATATAASGVATFSGLTLDKLGNYMLSVTGNGVGGTTTDLVQAKATPRRASPTRAGLTMASLSSLLRR